MEKIKGYQILDQMNKIKRHLSTVVRHLTPLKAANIALAEWNMLRRKAVVSNMPFMIKIEPTNICNIKCEGCWSYNLNSWTGSHEYLHPKGVMTFDTFKIIVDQLYKYITTISLYGNGEPLLNRDIYRMIAYANEKNIGCVTSANLMIFSEQDAAAMIDSQLEHLIVAVDTLNPELYAKYRIGGKLSVVLENLTMLIEEKKKRNAQYPIVEMQSIIREENLDETAALAEYAAKIGVDRYTAKEDSELLRKTDLESRYGKPCHWLWCSAYFGWDGIVCPCGCAYIGEDTIYGNILKQPFKEIWNNDKYVRSRQIYSSKKPDPKDVEDIKECYMCPLFPNKYFGRKTY